LTKAKAALYAKYKKNKRENKDKETPPPEFKFRSRKDPDPIQSIQGLKANWGKMRGEFHDVFHHERMRAERRRLPE